MKVPTEGGSVKIDEIKLYHVIKELLQDISYILRNLFFYLRNWPKHHKIKEWTANCKPKEGRSNNSDALSLRLERRYLKQLSFIIHLPSDDYWRAGVMIGNHNCSLEKIIDSPNAITCHIGIPEKIHGGQKVWIYDKIHKEGKPRTEHVETQNKKEICFSIIVSNKNYLYIQIENQLVYKERISSSFREKAYLLAWADDAISRVKFTNIKWRA